MNWKHWAGIVVVLAIGYYLGMNGTLNSVLSKVGIPTS